MDAMNKVILMIEDKKQKGVTTVEYAVMLVLVAIGVLALGQGIDDSVTGVFTNIAGSLSGTP